MRVLIVYNPVSGKGRSLAAIERVEPAIRAAGHEVVRCATELAPPAEWLAPRLDGVDAVIIAGGDGAIRMAAGALIDRGIPMWHLPAGTENLFARHFGMSGEAEAVVAALDAGRSRPIDAAEADGVPFTLMASVGIDAEVVHDLAGRRGASISHLSYIRPVLRQLREWTPPVLEVEVDGEVVTAGRPGFVVVANCREYMMRIDPAWAATMTDGVLDVVWLPMKSWLDVAAWGAMCRLGRQAASSRIVHERARRVVIRSETPFLYQVDGDPPDDPRACKELAIEVRPDALRVLLPPA